MSESRRTFLVVRADVASAFRTAVAVAWQVDAAEYLGVHPCRRATDAPGSPASHYVAHGHIPLDAWGTLVGILDGVSVGKRSVVKWADRDLGVAVTDADWAAAYDGDDIVVGFLLTYRGSEKRRSPRELIGALGLVSLSEDADDGLQ